MMGVVTQPIPEELPMDTIAQVANALQTVLSDVADQAAYRTGFVQRESNWAAPSSCKL